MKHQLNEYIIQHQSKKLEPASKDNESDLMTETICNDDGEPIIYKSLRRVNIAIYEMRKNNPARRFRFKKIIHWVGDWK